MIREASLETIGSNMKQRVRWFLACKLGKKLGKIGKQREATGNKYVGAPWDDTHTIVFYKFSKMGSGFHPYSLERNG